MIKETELIENFRDLNLGISITPHAIQLNQIKITIDFRGQIRQAQQRDVNFQHTVHLVKSGKLTGFALNKEGIWRYQGRICVPEETDLRKRILNEAHKSEFTIHPGINKMYQDLNKIF